MKIDSAILFLLVVAALVYFSSSTKTITHKTLKSRKSRDFEDYEVRVVNHASTTSVAGLLYLEGPGNCQPLGFVLNETYGDMRLRKVGCMPREIVIHTVNGALLAKDKWIRSRIEAIPGQTNVFINLTFENKPYFEIHPPGYINPPDIDENVILEEEREEVKQEEEEQAPEHYLVIVVNNLSRFQGAVGGRLEYQNCESKKFELSKPGDYEEFGTVGCAPKQLVIDVYAGGRILKEVFPIPAYSGRIVEAFIRSGEYGPEVDVRW